MLFIKFIIPSHMKLTMSMALAIAKFIPSFGTFASLFCCQFLLQVSLNPFSSIVSLCDGGNLFHFFDMCILLASMEVVGMTTLTNEVKCDGRFQLCLPTISKNNVRIGTYEQMYIILVYCST